MQCTAPKWGFMGLRPCRSCAACASYERYIWRTRAIFETRASVRSAFFTLTFRKSEASAYDEIQRWLKRVRKAHPSMVLRYLCVLELGEKNRRRHYHLIIHADRPFVLRDVRRLWKGGISHARLMRASDIRYVTKYITKGSPERPRASISYGYKPVRAVLTHPLITSVFRRFPSARRVTFNGETIPRRLWRAAARVDRAEIVQHSLTDLSGLSREHTRHLSTLNSFFLQRMQEELHVDERIQGGLPAPAST